MQYLIVIEKTTSGYSAFSPDLDGCVATGSTNKICARRLNSMLKVYAMKAPAFLNFHLILIRGLRLMPTTVALQTRLFATT